MHLGKEKWVVNRCDIVMCFRKNSVDFVRKVEGTKFKGSFIVKQAMM